MEASKSAAQIMGNKTSRSARASRWINGESLLALAFILPSLIGFTIFFAVPIVRGISISFTEWNLIREPKFVGLEDYTELLDDRDFWNALNVTIQYVMFNIPLQTVLALFIAVVMNGELLIRQVLEEMKMCLRLNGLCGASLLVLLFSLPAVQAPEVNVVATPLNSATCSETFIEHPCPIRRPPAAIILAFLRVMAPARRSTIWTTTVCWTLCWATWTGRAPSYGTRAA